MQFQRSLRVYFWWQHIDKFCSGSCSLCDSVWCVWERAAGRGQCGGRRGNPTQRLSRDCVFAVFLLRTQCNKVPFAVYCGVVNARGSRAEFYSSLQSDSFLFFIYYDHGDMIPAEILSAQRRSLYLWLIKQEYFCTLTPQWPTSGNCHFLQGRDCERSRNEFCNRTSDKEEEHMNSNMIN